MKVVTTTLYAKTKHIPNTCLNPITFILLYQTSVPLNYARHALRGLTIWLLTLPFCLVRDLGLLTGPVTGVMAWLLFGVYQIGYSIEDPFQGSLELPTLCDAIRTDVLSQDLSAFQMMDDDETEDGSDLFWKISQRDHPLQTVIREHVFHHDDTPMSMQGAQSVVFQP
jgi:hypothetical protein